jgi:hypothetical protein
MNQGINSLIYDYLSCSFDDQIKFSEYLNDVFLIKKSYENKIKYIIKSHQSNMLKTTNKDKDCFFCYKKKSFIYKCCQCKNPLKCCNDCYDLVDDFSDIICNECANERPY